MKRSTDYAANLIGTMLLMLLDEYSEEEIKRMLSTGKINEMIKVLKDES